MKQPKDKHLTINNLQVNYNNGGSFIFIVI